MNSETLRKEEIFNAAVEIVDADARQAYLDDVCAGDTRLREEIEELIESDVRAGSFLELPPTGLSPTIDQPLTQKTGTQIGPYKLLQQIGEGGMGVVYMAEQKQPVKRRVALKIIKPGMDSQQVIARFEAERQALAMMDHPNIAKVLDAGTTESGCPYFVMELVKGVPITQFCDDHRLSARERLESFIPVCRAIQHAHQKGIIHRDLKPSNVLVAEYDHKPVPKVIDFGVAKAVSQELTESTLFTQFGQIVGTLDYMSPEQAKFNQLDIDTRSDIYSLGVLLYELLTGSTPIERDRLRNTGLEEILRVIREEEPPKPSTRLSSSQMLPALAASRSTEPAKLASQLREDLDWIVIKALAKERDERYQTAEALAADIELHLQDRPIVARRPSTVGRVRRYVRRHKLAFYLTTIALAASLAAVSFGLVAYVARLKQGKQQAALQATQAEAELMRLVDQRRMAALKIEMPGVEQLWKERKHVEAFQLASEIQEVLAGNPAFQNLWDKVTAQVNFDIQPAGTEVYYRGALNVDGDWHLAGRSPLENVRLPNANLRFRFVKQGYVTKEFQRPFPAFTDWVSQHALRPEQGDPEGMVHVPGIGAASWNDLPTAIGEFLIDRYEVSNGEFQEFVDAGGYQKPEFWSELEFVREGQTLTWDEAMEYFVDATGNARGPSSWHAGRFPTGEEDYPVNGLSWFEAMAYAKFAGKSLPTVHHWKWAGNSEDVGTTTALANYSSLGLARRGAHTGIGRFEVYDMAGNAKEWCWNDSEEGERCLMGGAWNESEYRFTMVDFASPWDRSQLHGFRCVRYLSEAAPEELTLQSIPKHVRTHPEMAREPIESLRKWYEFDHGPLNIEQVQLDDDDPSPDFRHEIVRVDAAYNHERLEIHLFLPRHKQEKYETVVWVPGMDRWNSAGEFTSTSYHDMAYVADLPKSGRIVCHPIYMGTFQRFSGTGFHEQFRQSPLKARDDFIAVSKDVSRAVDYLLSRSDVDANRLVYFGHSLGAYRGPATLATESRFKAGVLLSGGYIDNLISLPEIDSYQFTPHVETPVLMINGIFDTIGAVESSQIPCFEDLGSQVKKHAKLTTGHNPPAEDVFREMDAWLKQIFSGDAASSSSEK